jgi:hypothetical protein
MFKEFIRIDHKLLEAPFGLARPDIAWLGVGQLGSAQASPLAIGVPIAMAEQGPVTVGDAEGASEHVVDDEASECNVHALCPLFVARRDCVAIGFLLARFEAAVTAALAHLRNMGPATADAAGVPIIDASSDPVSTRFLNGVITVRVAPRRRLPGPQDLEWDGMPHGHHYGPFPLRRQLDAADHGHHYGAFPLRRQLDAAEEYGATAELLHPRAGRKRPRVTSLQLHTATLDLRRTEPDDGSRPNR